MRHRNTEGLSDIGKQIIKSCPNAYVEDGKVYDPCHFWFSNQENPASWNSVSTMPAPPRERGE